MLPQFPHNLLPSRWGADKPTWAGIVLGSLRASGQQMTGRDVLRGVGMGGPGQRPCRVTDPAPVPPPPPASCVAGPCPYPRHPYANLRMSQPLTGGEVELASNLPQGRAMSPVQTGAQAGVSLRLCSPRPGTRRPGAFRRFWGSLGTPELVLGCERGQASAWLGRCRLWFCRGRCPSVAAGSTGSSPCARLRCSELGPNVTPPQARATRGVTSRGLVEIGAGAGCQGQGPCRAMNCPVFCLAGSALTGAAPALGAHARPPVPAPGR